MYCVKCGVELGDAERKCPLCGTPVYCPDGNAPASCGYPKYNEEHGDLPRTGIMTFISVLFLIPLIICFLIDLRLNKSVTWSGIVMISGAALYATLLLPFWFKKYNPVIFVPVSFAAIGGLLLYLDIFTGGGWFLTLAFPITVSACIIVTAACALFRYLKKGKLFVLGGFLIMLGVLTVLIEFFIFLTFATELFVWSIYSFAVFFLLGLLVIFVACNKKTKEYFVRKFFF